MITVNLVAPLFYDYHKINYGKLTRQNQFPESNWIISKQWFLQNHFEKMHLLVIRKLNDQLILIMTFLPHKIPKSR